MKNLLPALFMLLCCASKVKAQTYVPFPDSGAMFVNVTYHYAFLGGNPFPTVINYDIEKHFLEGQDTLINSRTYTKIRCNEFYNNYAGAIRDSIGKVYLVPPDSTQEFLLYDFTAQSGSTIQNVLIRQLANDFYYILHSSVQVHSVDTVIINNIPRRRINLQSGGNSWIEGIGCTAGLSLDHFGNISNFKNELHCMTLNDTVLMTPRPLGLLSGALPNTCDSLVGINNLFSAMSISLFPNPASENIHIYGLHNAEQTQCLVYDELGKEFVVPLTVAPAEITIDLSLLPGGVYVLVLKNSEGIVSKKLVKTAQ